MGIIENYKYQRGMSDYLPVESEVEAYIKAMVTNRKALLAKKEIEATEQAAAKDIIKIVQDEMKSLKL